jgi:hypothetical protein
MDALSRSLKVLSPVHVSIFIASPVSVMTFSDESKRLSVDNIYVWTNMQIPVLCYVVL